MSELQHLDGSNLAVWMQLVLRSQASADHPESNAILAAHNAIVALQRKNAHADDTGVALTWDGEDPMWSARAPGDRLAVVVTDDDEASRRSPPTPMLQRAQAQCVHPLRRWSK